MILRSYYLHLQDYNIIIDFNDNDSWNIVKTHNCYWIHIIQIYFINRLSISIKHLYFTVIIIIIFRIMNGWAIIVITIIANKNNFKGNSLLY